MKIIQVKNISKKYYINANRGRYIALRDTLANIVKSPIKFSKDKIIKIKNTRKEEFWALKDINFEMEQGEVLGIIGHNGAGKSTLLKILSQITPPTTGEIRLKGRVGSLLEVGTGFHPELTGRENILLNGAILGMKKSEIVKKFDEIVEFAGVEKFLDTPVKYYSSGMYVRLAFSVAAHMEPEILIVDEVLAVGDAEFQKKCLGKMDEITKSEGRTILFVSHNMNAIASLCNKCIILKRGEMHFNGKTEDAIGAYLNMKDNHKPINLKDRKDRRGSGDIRFTGAWIEDSKGNKINTVLSGQDIKLVAEYETLREVASGSLTVAFNLNNSKGEQLSDLWAGKAWTDFPGNGRISCLLPHLPLNTGNYYFNICARINKEIADALIDVVGFEVQPGPFFKNGQLPDPNQGSFLFNQEWNINQSYVRN